MGSSPDDPTINDPVYDPGSKPTMGSSAITVKAVAFKTGYLPSAVASANYTPPAIPVTLAIKVGNSIVNYTGGPPTYYNINYGDIAQFRVVFLDPQQHEIPFFMAQAPSQYAWSANGPTAIPIAIPVRSDNTFVFPSDVGSLLTIWPSGWFTTFNLSVFVMGPPDGYVLSGPNSATVLIMLHSSDAPSVKIAPASGTYPYSQRIMYAVNKVGSGMSKDGAACRIDGPLHSWTTCPTLMLGLTSDTNLHLLEARACPCSGSPPVCNTICSQDSDYVYATPTTFICSNCAGDLIIANNLHATPHTGSVTVTFDLLSGAINPYAGLYTDASCTLQAYGGGMPPPPLQAQIYPTTLVTHTATINNVPTGAYYFSVADQGFYPWYGGPPVMSKECVPVIVP
jgi:hypothetical protein